MKYIEELIELASKSDMNNKHGAILVFKGKIISKGFNRRTGDKKNCKYSIHAECDAINNCDRNLVRYSSMYVIQISNDDKNILKCSKPCRLCEKVIKKYNIKTCKHS